MALNHFSRKKSYLLLLLVCSILCVPAFGQVEFSQYESKDATLRIAMLHLDLKYADIEHNRRLIESGIVQAAAHNADWVLTPELALTGYRFDLKLGTDWIEEGPNDSVKRIQTLARKHGVNVFLSHLEGLKDKIKQSDSDKSTLKFYNTLFVIGRNGDILGRHHKINTIPVAESWSAAGSTATSLTIDDINVGLLICADAWPATHARSLKQNGAELIVSSANWAPGKYGPKDTWEKRSLETGIPVLVNNRTGFERGLDLTQSESAVSVDGQRLLSHASYSSKIVVFDWFHTQRRVANVTRLDINGSELMGKSESE